MPLHLSFSKNVGPSTTIQPSQPVRFDQFVLFQKLPKELRLEIWRLALPCGPTEDGVRVLCVRAFPQCLVAGNPASCKFRFVKAQQRFVRKVMGCYPPPKMLKPDEALEKIKTEIEADEADLRDVRLLKVCYESRAVFMEAFPYSILVDAKEYGQIRFNHQTILNITNILSEDVRDWILKAKDIGCELPSFKEVRYLAIDNDQTFKHDHSALALTLFGGLECLKVSIVPFTRFDKYCIICFGGRWAGSQPTHVSSVKRYQSRIGKSLAAFASDISLDFRLPKVDFCQHPEWR